MLKSARPQRNARPGLDKVDEQGSIIVAIMIIMIMVLIGTALADRAIGGSLLVLTRQNTSAGLAAAEAGVADALFRIDQGPPGTFCVSPTVANCKAAAVPALAGGATVSYEATMSNATSWTVDAIGTYRGASAAVQETVGRSALYPFAVFGNSGLTFNGSSPNGFGTYSSGDPAGNVDTTAPVSIGSNGTITCNGGLGSNVTSYYVGGVGGVSGSCGSKQSVTSQFPYTTPSAPTSPTPAQCPVDGSGNITSPLPGGTYLCTAPVTMGTSVSVTGSVKLYIILDPSVYSASTQALTIAASTNINYTPGAALPDARRLQIFSNSNGTFGNSNGQGYTFSGIIYAPNAALTADGCKSVYYGALVINTLTCNGGPHLTVYYQNDLTQLYGNWMPSAYLQIPPSLVSIHP